MYPPGDNLRSLNEVERSRKLRQKPQPSESSTSVGFRPLVLLRELEHWSCEKVVSSLLGEDEVDRHFSHHVAPRDVYTL